MSFLDKVISKVSGAASAPAPASNVRIRRAHQPASRKEPATGEVLAEGVDRAQSQHEAAPAVAHVESIHIDVITSEKDLPDWRGVISELVRETEACVVLDLGFKSVLVLGTPAFFGSGTHSALLSRLKTKGLHLDGEKTTTKEVIAAVRTKAERAVNQLGPRVNLEAANVQLYKDLCSGALKMGVSDIHILLDFDARSTVRVRLDGKSRLWRTFDTPILNSALAAGYNGLSLRGTNSNSDWTLDRAINTITQFSDGTTTINGRLSTQTITGGAKVVIRVSDGNTEVIANQTLSDSGFTYEQIHQQILPALKREKGFVLVGGSTGAGKTVTLQRMIMAIPGREWKEVSAIEDPNEARIPGVAHHSIQRNTDDSPEKVKVMFDSAFMTNMRQDPDVMMVGEIRDRTSANLATDAVLTGHLLMVTMHGNSAIGQLFRLMNDRIGMDPEVLADEENFALSMAQSLVPRLCLHCRKPAHDVMSENDLNLLRTKWRLDTRKMFCASGTGCEHCTPDGLPGTGEKGRIVAAEIITKPTPEFLQCLLNRDRMGAELAWRQTRRSTFDSPDMQGKTSYENALYHVSQGLVSPLALGEVFGKEFADIRIIEVPETADVVRLAVERAA